MSAHALVSFSLVLEMSLISTEATKAETEE